MWNEQLSLWLAALLLSLVLPATGTTGETPLLQERLSNRRCDNYLPATPQQLQQAESAFASLLQTPASVDAQTLADWRALGFTSQHFMAGEVEWLLLYQQPDQCTGQGLYLVRLGVAADLALQIPHGYFDRDTDDIAAGLLQTPVRVIAFNTARRHYLRDGNRVDADLAHRSDSLFNALTRTFGRLFPSGRVVQLHGFNAQTCSSEAGRTAAAIISAGTTAPSPDSKAVAACLQTRLAGPVRLYPRDIGELGGTTNVQGRLLRAEGHAGFVHVELSRETREQLRDDDRLRAGFGACLSANMPLP
jgi:hypothetical protein